MVVTLGHIHFLWSNVAQPPNFIFSFSWLSPFIRGFRAIEAPYSFYGPWAINHILQPIGCFWPNYNEAKGAMPFFPPVPIVASNSLQDKRATNHLGTPQTQAVINPGQFPSRPKGAFPLTWTNSLQENHQAHI
ncbi:hypothetical protein O181_042231 [Austropuccinia psidii MF-1]|uniref:Uncharacterized protein n=1 Tax=Austropuccinia psidii MF-1 TaxID=1389203 RepID=A0A9Q3DEH4_9BASI|nr:hypothetical protein [Austropuccinia psidii MF-1]